MAALLEGEKELAEAFRSAPHGGKTPITYRTTVDRSGGTTLTTRLSVPKEALLDLVAAGAAAGLDFQ